MIFNAKTSHFSLIDSKNLMIWLLYLIYLLGIMPIAISAITDTPATNMPMNKSVLNSTLSSWLLVYDRVLPLQDHQRISESVNKDINRFKVEVFDKLKLLACQNKSQDFAYF